MNEQLAVLRQALLDDGWGVVEIQYFRERPYPIVDCTQFSPLAGEPYICRTEVALELLPGDAPRIVRRCREQYRWALSGKVDERWTGPPRISAWDAFLLRPDPPPLDPWCDPKAEEA